MALWLCGYSELCAHPPASGRLLMSESQMTINGGTNISIDAGRRSVLGTAWYPPTLLARYGACEMLALVLVFLCILENVCSKLERAVNAI